MYRISEEINNLKEHYIKVWRDVCDIESSTENKAGTYVKIEGFGGVF